ncbi:hypothetical protein ABT024_40900, partial [Streptomyces sp. NPDC002812]|uniref:hypothetical protein n=1 Tax=Streptomyces sp. NPDC002812 TaxID=3154434 RepID=UPI003330EBDC
MPDNVGSWKPGPRVTELLFVDFDGLTADPDDVISDGLDGGYRERTKALREVLRKGVQPVQADEAQRPHAAQDQ